MSVLLTDKIIQITEERDFIKLTGPLHDEITLPKNGSINKYHYCHKYNLNITIKKSSYHSKRLSLIINNGTLTDYAELLLYMLTLIEASASQLVLGKPFDPATLLKIYTEDEKHETAMLDCQIGSQEYDHIINSLTSKNPQFAKSLLTLKDARWIGESIRSELFHTEYCIKQIIYHSAKAARSHKEEHPDKIVFKTEHRVYNQDSDAAYWNFCDAIKSLATAIDITISYLFYMSTLQPDKKSKVQRIIYKDFKASYKKISHKTNFPNKNLDLLCSSNQELFLIRNELTHNQQFGSIRQPIFLGIGTSVVNNLNISYVDMMLWDYENNNLCRSSGRCSFFKQRRNIFGGLIKYVEAAVNFIDAALENIFFTIKNNLSENNITYITYPTNFSSHDLGAKSIDLQTIKNAHDLKKMLNTINVKSLNDLTQKYRNHPLYKSD